MPDVPLQEDPKATVFEHIEVQRRGSITIITIARPAARNALHVPAHFELARAIDDFAADDQAWVAIITGSGDRAFCAGQDLTQPLPVDASDLPPSGFGGMTTRFDLTKPVIAAVNGFAFGGGFELALACDLIVASETARFGLPEPKVGVVALAGGIQRITQELGLKQAMGLLLTGATLAATDAQRMGVVNEVVQGDAMDGALHMAEAILACSPLAVRATKEAAMASLSLPLTTSIRDIWTRPAVQQAIGSQAAQEGRNSFLEKRPPRWSGK